MRDDDVLTQSDERVLELIREHGNLTPGAISKFTGSNAAYISARASRLVRLGLLHRIDTGLYGITDDGHAFLDEKLERGVLASRAEALNDDTTE
ncbi:MarR family transcriptional regulator [Halomarina oriensis]|uniref:MarR family transcriptional regulator n=1 Tax=Halomarina oriensis TaxID=671145 RepID=A0A6B0GM90_9EURY|nr:MarR family transcriptional regulator [Halomarina oriensis]MWG34797.1 MarR family transcriptional regulator [Halomarina oriensis]